MSKVIPVALFLALAPGQICGENFALEIFAAIMLTPRLLGAILVVGLKYVLDAVETLQHIFYARRPLIFPHVAH